MTKLKEKVEKYLKANPGSEVHTTKDGFLFTRKQDATAHAVTLVDREVTSYGKSASELEPAPVDTISGKQLDPAAPAEMKVEKGTRPEDKKPAEAPKETPEPAKAEEEIKKADVAKEEITESAETPVKAKDKPKETAVKDDQKSAPKKKTKTTKE